MAQVYLITNSTNGKYYVGQTRKTADRRWQSHLRGLKRNHCPKLYAAVRKYGKEAFTVEVLANISDEQLDRCERLWIAALDAQNDAVGYNLDVGGAGRKEYRVSEETRANMSLAQKGRKFSEEHKHNLGLAQLGNKKAAGCRRSLEHRAKISVARRGKHHSAAARAKISAAMLGNQHRRKNF